MGLLDFKKVLEQSKRDLLDKPKEALLGQKAKLLNQAYEEENKLIGFDKEESFLSSGKNNLRRYYQALYYGEGVYGMECNACCMMYYLQSYGLIPPIKRKRFEYAFTPLKPKRDVYAKSESDSKASIIFIPNKENPNRQYEAEEGNLMQVVPDIYDSFFKNPSLFLRGYKDGGAIFPHLSDSQATLFGIFKKIYDLSLKQGYSFLRKNHLQKAVNEVLSDKIKNKYAALVNGIQSESYFDKHCIMVGLSCYPPYPGHYALIVNTPRKRMIDDVEFWDYPADDPLEGNTRIFVPATPISDLEVMERKVRNRGGYLIFTNCAIGV